jgi:hypothetical protein
MDTKVVVGIHQPNFMPWLGYFYKIFQSDVFIFLDDVQFQKTGACYTNRVNVNINGNSCFLTVPIKRLSGLWHVNETKFVDNKWKKKIINNLQSNYAKANFFKLHRDFMFNLIEFDSSNLADYNINFITNVSDILNLNTTFVISSTFQIQLTSTERLICLIENVGGNIYLSGSGGDKYQDHEMYKQHNIELVYNKMPSFKYQQIKTDKFIAGLSIVDAIFNIGLEKLKEELFTLPPK